MQLLSPEKWYDDPRARTSGAHHWSGSTVVTNKSGWRLAGASDGPAKSFRGRASPPNHYSTNLHGRFYTVKQTPNPKMSSIEAQELERLSEADKNDLRKFLTNEQQKTQIQSRESLARQALPVQRSKNREHSRGS
jgi:hypothetical protein